MDCPASRSDGRIYGFTDLDESLNLGCMSTVEEIEAAIPKLSRAEIEELRLWIDEFHEDQLELKDEEKEKLDRSRAEIQSGNYVGHRREIYK